MKQFITLPAIKESTQDYEALEKAIRDIYKKEVYLPILRELGMRNRRLLKNANFSYSGMSILHEALQRGQITFNRGVFSGKFDSEITKAFRELGAVWDRSNKVYRLHSRYIPLRLRASIASSERRFSDTIYKIDRVLGTVYTEEIEGRGISQKLKTTHFFDRAIFKVDKQFHQNVRNITIAPTLTPDQRKRIAEEWGQNMQLWIADFTKKEIIELRQKMLDTIFAGDRYGSAVKTIQESFGVTEGKAKFLARQETGLLMAKFKQTRYQAAGIDYYRWDCVAGSAAHPVRPFHKKNNKKVCRWDDPPTTDAAGNRKNPGQDYNCRCGARPMVGYSGPYWRG